MSIIVRSSLEASPLADLHAIASELAIDGYRRLRRPELIQAILDQQTGSVEGAVESVAGTEVEPNAPSEGDEGEPGAERPGIRRRRGRRGGRGRGSAGEEEAIAPIGGDETDGKPEPEDEPETDGKPRRENEAEIKGK